MRSLRIRTFCGVLAFLPGFLVAQTFTEDGVRLIGSNTSEGRSASFADIENDGDLDLLIQGSTGARRLYLNNTIGLGTDTFTDVTAALGPLASDTSGWSAAWADVDGDGLVDLFLGESNTCSTCTGDFFLNKGLTTGFVDVSSTTIPEPGFHQNVAWVDIDNDKDLDLIIGMEGPERHQIYLQGPAMKFTAVGAETGFQADYGTKAYGMAIGDYDDDGDLDIYISTCIATDVIRNNFFENRLIPDGTLSFVDIADTNGTQFMSNSYGCEFADFDDDGDLDLYMTGADGNPTQIWRNNGNKTWTNVGTSILGHDVLSNNGADLNGSRAVDYDNDGDLDLYFHDNLTNNPDLAQLLYRNDGNWVFTDVTVAEGLGLTHKGAYDSVWGDYDNDGDLDLVLPTTSGSRKRFFVSNASTNGNHWLYLRLKGPAENTRAIGAQVYATIFEGSDEERTLRRDNNLNAGAFNQSDLPIHFGLGSAASVDRLRIVWPDGQESEYRNIAANQNLELEPAPPAPPAKDVWTVQ